MKDKGFDRTHLVWGRYNPHRVPSLSR